MAHDPDRNGWWWLLIAAAIGGGGYGGYKLYQHTQQKKVARLSGCSLLAPIGSAARHAECALTFQAVPPPDLAEQLRVEVTGKTLAEPASFDWRELLKHFRYNRVKPGAPVPVGQELRMALPIALVSSLTPGVGDFIVTVRLFWGTKEIDSTIFNTKGLFAPKG